MSICTSLCSPWQVPPKSVVLRAHEAHIWREYINWTDEAVVSGYSTLSQEEKCRADRFVFPESRRDYIVAHTLLRKVLSIYTKMPSECLNFRHGTHGKPYLCDSKLQFNLSHSRHIVICVVSHQPVGIDVEYVETGADIEKLVHRFFAAEEHQELLALVQAERLRAFYRGWARKEAYIKVTGEGLSFGLNNFVVSLTPTETNCLLSIHQDAKLAQRWALRSIDVDPDYEAALAVEGSIKHIFCWQWQ